VIEETGRVVATDTGHAWVETQRHSACGSCAARGGCGTSVLSRVLGQRAVRVRAIDKIGASVGDRVVVGMDDAALLRGSMAVYLTPVLAMIGAAFVTEALAPQWGFGDGLTVVGGGLGLLAGFVWLRLFSRRVGNDARYQALVLRRVAERPEIVHTVEFHKS